jgi:uncharacterized PurR-regulated membrane protein YhhQ (DUF165 family)
VALIFWNFFWKLGTEILFTPVTYSAIHYLKKKDGIDVYDYDTRFNPFSWK